MDVVDREDVRGVDDRDQEGLRVDVADRHRLVAASGGDREQVGRSHVHVEAVEVEVVEAVALGNGAGELVVVDQLLLDEQFVGGAIGRPRLLDDRVDALASGVAELDDHIGEEHR